MVREAAIAAGYRAGGRDRAIAPLPKDSLLPERGAGEYDRRLGVRWVGDDLRRWHKRTRAKTPNGCVEPLTEAALAATKTKDSYYAAQYQRLRGRRGHSKAITAVGHSILTAAWHMLTNGELHRDLGGDNFTQRDPEKTTKRLARQLQALGHIVTLQTAMPTAEVRKAADRREFDSEKHLPPSSWHSASATTSPGRGDPTGTDLHRRRAPLDPQLGVADLHQPQPPSKLVTASPEKRKADKRRIAPADIWIRPRPLARLTTGAFTAQSGRGPIKARRPITGRYSLIWVRIAGRALRCAPGRAPSQWAG